MKVLSVTGPWAWAIVHAGKDIENRSWQTGHRGALGIHASRCPSKRQRAEIVAEIEEIAPALVIPEEVRSGEPEGQLLGIVRLTGITRESGSDWAMWGNYFWHVADPVAVRRVPAKGRLGLWEYTGALEIAGRQCPRCGSTLITRGDWAWCTYVGGRDVPACWYGLGRQVPLADAGREVDHG